MPAAVTYSDLWKVEDAKYQPQTITVKKNALKTLVLNPVPDAGFSITKDYRKKIGGGTSYIEYFAFSKSPYFEASSNIPGKGGTRASHELESWLKFDLGELPSDANIIKDSWHSIHIEMITKKNAAETITLKIEIIMNRHLTTGQMKKVEMNRICK